MDNFQILKEEVEEASLYCKWKDRDKEWGIVDIQLVSVLETCACGHYPIKEVITIYNGCTDKSLKIGNVCMKHFSSEDWLTSSAVIKDTRKYQNIPDIVELDRQGLRPSRRTINWLNHKGVVTDYEERFLLDIQRKRALTGRQRDFLMQTNIKIHNVLCKNKGGLS